MALGVSVSAPELQVDPSFHVVDKVLDEEHGADNISGMEGDQSSVAHRSIVIFRTGCRNGEGVVLYFFLGLGFQGVPCVAASSSLGDRNGDVAAQRRGNGGGILWMNGTKHDNSCFNRGALVASACRRSGGVLKAVHA